jgi:hypothetical protein
LKDKFIARVQSTANWKSSVSLNVAEKMALCLLSWMSVRDVGRQSTDSICDKSKSGAYRTVELVGEGNPLEGG